MRRENLFWVYFGGMILMTVIGIALLLNYYYTTIYPLERDVVVHLDYVTKLTDAETIGRELDMALKGLENYHGNPSWIFPTVYSDFDYIREQIRSQRDMAYAMKNVPKTDYAYQRYIENVVRTAGELKGNIRDAEGWLVWAPRNVALGIVWVIAYIFLWIKAREY